jgi:hypothetical protein
MRLRITELLVVAGVVVMAPSVSRYLGGQARDIAPNSR